MKPEMRTKTCTLKNRDKSGLSGDLSMTKHDPSDEATMNPRDMCSLETELENQIRTLQPVRQRLMFSELTEVFPDCTWQILFNALGRLRKQKYVELVPHRWDYEVIFLTTGPSDRGMPGFSRTNERCDHEERAEV